MTLIGREDTAPGPFDNTGEYTRWIGKPWRRVEKLWHTYLWKGEEERTDTSWTLHLGSRRLGVFFTVILARQKGYDYSEEHP